MTNLPERVLKTIRQYEMLRQGDNVLVAVSGGPDSVFLLYMLLKLKRKLRLGRMCVCTLDHGLRGQESREDALFVRRIAELFGLPCEHKKIDLTKNKVLKKSIEEVARTERYKFFTVAAGKTGSNIIATGHTLDDQAETVVMRFLKGSSLKGLVGISPKRDEGDATVIRPLIQLTKEEILEYLKANDIPYRVDRSNEEPIYLRNVTRGEIIPFLEKFNPRLKQALFNLSEHVREDIEYIEEAKRSVSRLIKEGSDKGVAIRIKDIILQPKAIQKEVLRDMLANAGGDIKKLSFVHWKEMEQILHRSGKGVAIDLPGGIRITRTESELIFGRL